MFGNFFIRCFGLLQNATTITKFNFFIFNLVNIFLNPFNQESLSFSLNFLRDQLKESENLNQLNFDFTSDSMASENDRKISYSKIMTQLKISNNILRFEFIIRFRKS